MIRKIIRIDEEKCTGCGACARACHEGAIAMVDGKAKLLRDDYCDGMGDCLPQCPAGAISFEQREAAAYDAGAVAANRASAAPPAGCPGTVSRRIRPAASSPAEAADDPASALSNWPVQIKLAPVRALWFDRAELLIAADCTAYAYAGMHSRFMAGRITLVGCPKLDGVDYSEKLTDIVRQNDIRGVTVLRMEVPCCGGLELAVKKALEAGGGSVPLQVVTVTVDGRIKDAAG